MNSEGLAAGLAADISIAGRGARERQHRLMAGEILRAAIITAMCDIEYPYPPERPWLSEHARQASAKERDQIELERQEFGMMFAQSSVDELIDWLLGALRDGRVRLVARGPTT